MLGDDDLLARSHEHDETNTQVKKKVALPISKQAKGCTIRSLRKLRIEKGSRRTIYRSRLTVVHDQGRYYTYVN
jgi:hypothetical protein